MLDEVVAFANRALQLVVGTGAQDEEIAEM